MSIHLKQQVAVQHRLGLHLRVAQMIARAAQSYKSTISMVSDQRTADAKSLLELLMLAAESGTVLIVEAVGVDATEAMRDILSVMSDLDDNKHLDTANSAADVTP